MSVSKEELISVIKSKLEGAEDSLEQFRDSKSAVARNEQFISFLQGKAKALSELVEYLKIHDE